MFFNKLDNCFEKAEFILGLAACVPGLNLAAADVRASLGTSQVIGGLGSAAFHYFASAFAQNEHQQQKLEGRALKSLDYAKHGLLNCIRAIYEHFLVISFILVVKDAIFGKHHYETYIENQNNVVYHVHSENTSLSDYNRLNYFSNYPDQYSY